MLRVTMISTMPVAMIAIDVLWTDRFQRLRDVMNLPSDIAWNATQITASAATMPSSRVSISDFLIRSWNVRGVLAAGATAVPAAASVVSLIGVLAHQVRP